MSVDDGADDVVYTGMGQLGGGMTPELVSQDTEIKRNYQDVGGYLVESKSCGKQQYSLAASAMYGNQSQILGGLGDSQSNINDVTGGGFDERSHIVIENQAKTQPNLIDKRAQAIGQAKVTSTNDLSL